jgi:1-hydroxycarotenoid 3,4-desaturase
MNAAQAADFDVVVVGGGMGGLSAAVALGAAGKRVVLLERADAVGGKVAEVVVDGVGFDTGPSVLTLPDVIDRVLQHAGMSVAADLPLVRPSPAFRYHAEGQAPLDIFVDEADTLASIERTLGAAAATELRAFLQYAKGIWDTSKDDFVFGAAPTATTLLRLGMTRPFDMLKVDPLHSMRQAIWSRISHPLLRTVLLRYATYNGSDPTTAPATLNCIAHVELGLGGFGVLGGMGMLAKTLRRAAERVGVVCRTNTSVDELVLRDGRCVGVRVGDEVINAASVVVNADVGWLRTLPGAVPKALPSPSSLSMSGATMVLKARRRSSRVAHEVVFPEADYLEEFADIFQRRRGPRSPTIYVCAQEQAQGRTGWKDHEPLFVMVNAPALAAGVVDDGVALLQSARARLLSKQLIDIDDEIVWQRTSTGLAAQFPGSSGSLYGAASNDRLSAFRRAPNALSGVPGLFLASGSAHPGGGVPLCAQSGLLAAQAVLAAPMS